jgi:hypothetical protein
MYNQVTGVVKHCATCHYQSYKAPAAPMIGHTTATATAQALALDVIHLSDQNGYRYGLTTMDAWSR